ncbi:MAG: hypothetical protein KGO47_07335 [Cyanobacteria bacterium REEB417]|nr:hypothetical protein [Cyanobacteria bacterium REEB417]
MTCRELICGTVALCLGLAAVGGFGGAMHCQLRGGDCLELWKAAGAGALAAATTGGTLLAQLDGRRRPEDEAAGVPEGDGGRG